MQGHNDLHRMNHSQQLLIQHALKAHLRHERFTSIIAEQCETLLDASQCLQETSAQIEAC